MNPIVGWTLAVVGTAIGWVAWGWRGVALAISAMVFWLLLQFTRALRAMRTAGSSPIGQVDSAVMLHARLRKGMRLMDILMITRSLGEKLADGPETYAWRDTSGACVRVELQAGRCTGWVLDRPKEADGTPPAD